MIVDLLNVCLKSEVQKPEVVTEWKITMFNLDMDDFTNDCWGSNTLNDCFTMNCKWDYDIIVDDSVPELKENVEAWEGFKAQPGFKAWNGSNPYYVSFYNLVP